jgi:hypothetical protein
MELKPNFIQWARSLSGCDGGDPKAKFWLCGIEWGYGKKDGNPEEYYNIELRQEIEKGKYEPAGIYHWEDTLKHTYGRNVAKLYYAIIGKNVADYRNVVTECDGSEIFKMNLYPIAFNNTDDQLWKKYHLNELTGFEEKNLFKTWCFLNRFPAILSLVNQYQPHLIIGTGISYLTDFFVCFAGDASKNTIINFGEVVLKTKEDKDIKRSYYWAKLKNGTTLVVVPFFSGSYGLNSNDLIQEIGNKIKQLL